MSNCVIHHKEPRAASVGYLCAGHFQRLSAMLRDVEDQAAVLDARPSMQQRTGSGHGSLASERTPVRLDVLVHTDHRRGTGKSETEDDAFAAGDTLPILDVLHSWARIVREERALNDDGTATVTEERALLTRHLDWCADQPWIDEMFADLRQLVGQLKAANGARPERPVGKCYLAGDEDDGRCGGNIWRLEQPSLAWRVLADRCARFPVDVADGPARCDKCGNEWDGAAVERLIAILREEKRPTTDDGEKMYTAEELVARRHATSVANVRVIAHRKGLVSVNGYYDPRPFIAHRQGRVA